MAGVSVESGKGGRKSLDSEINMVPMIDLLMVTISFLLITAVWVQSARMPADAQVPGPASSLPPCSGEECKEDVKLHVETSDPATFRLVWRQGRDVVRTVAVPREPQKLGRRVAFPGLAAKVADEWHASGAHRDPRDKKPDRAVVHAPNDMPYAELIAVMDAVSHPKRPLAIGPKVTDASAFDITFAAD